jgi:hypothetical protein
MQVLDVFVRSCWVTLGIGFTLTAHKTFKITFEYERLCPASGALSK